MPIPLTKQKNKFEEWKFYRFLNFAEEHKTRGWFFFFFQASSVSSILTASLVFIKLKVGFSERCSREFIYIYIHIYIYIYIYIYIHTHKLKNRFSVTLSFAPKRSSDRKYLCYLSFIYIRYAIGYMLLGSECLNVWEVYLSSLKVSENSVVGDVCMALRIQVFSNYPV